MYFSIDYEIRESDEIFFGFPGGNECFDFLILLFALVFHDVKNMGFGVG